MIRKVALVSVIVVLAVVFIFAGAEKSQANLKIAYVDLARAAKEFKEMKELNQNYQSDLEFYNKKLKELENEIKELEASGAPQDEINKKKKEYLEKQQLFQQLLQQEYQPKAQEILNKVITYAKEYAQEKEYDVLLTNNGAVYVSERMDVTDDFINYINSK